MASDASIDTSIISTHVLILGAGPSGLAAAIGLSFRNREIKCIVLDDPQQQQLTSSSSLTSSADTHDDTMPIDAAVATQKREAAAVISEDNQTFKLLDSASSEFYARNPNSSSSTMRALADMRFKLLHAECKRTSRDPNLSVAAQAVLDHKVGELGIEIWNGQDVGAIVAIERLSTSNSNMRSGDNNWKVIFEGGRCIESCYLVAVDEHRKLFTNHISGLRFHHSTSHANPNTSDNNPCHNRRLVLAHLLFSSSQSLTHETLRPKDNWTTVWILKEEISNGHGRRQTYVRVLLDISKDLKPAARSADDKVESFYETLFIPLPTATVEKVLWSASFHPHFSVASLDGFYDAGTTAESKSLVSNEGSLFLLGDMDEAGPTNMTPKHMKEVDKTIHGIHDGMHTAEVIASHFRSRKGVLGLPGFILSSNGGFPHLKDVRRSTPR